MVKQFLYHIPWILWALIISVLSLLPGDQLPEIKIEWLSIDTLVHIAMYLGLSFLILVGFFPRNKKGENKLNLSNFKLYGIVILVGISFGYFIELIQGNFITQRYFDISDIVANAFGTIFGIIGFSWIGRKLI